MKLAVIIFVMIPGTVPLIVGYTFSILYRFVDPDYLVLNFLKKVYLQTLGTLPVIFEILTIKIILLLVVIPYLLLLRKKYPSLTWIQISRTEIVSKLNLVAKPKSPGHKELEEL